MPMGELVPAVGLGCVRGSGGEEVWLDHSPVMMMTLSLTRLGYKSAL